MRSVPSKSKKNRYNITDNNAIYTTKAMEVGNKKAQSIH
jgi:hypothetical protein